jgi:hypothetical protein
MIIDRIREKIRGDFKPFTLSLSDGRSFLVPHPEQIAVGTRVLVLIADGDRVLTIDPTHVTPIEEDLGKKTRLSAG